VIAPGGEKVVCLEGEAELTPSAVLAPVDSYTVPQEAKMQVP